MQVYLMKAPDTAMSMTAIVSEIAEEYHVCERTAWRYVTGVA